MGMAGGALGYTIQLYGRILYSRYTVTVYDPQEMFFLRFPYVRTVPYRTVPYRTVPV